MTYWSWNVHDATFRSKRRKSSKQTHTVVGRCRAYTQLHIHYDSWLLAFVLSCSAQGPGHTTHARSFLETGLLLVCGYWSNSSPTMADQQLKPPVVCILFCCLCVCRCAYVCKCCVLWLLSSLDSGVGWVFEWDVVALFESRCCDEMLDESSMNVTGL